MAVAQLLIILAYQHATASQIAPFNYSVVIFSGLIGWIVWHNTLDWVSGVGILLVCVGGILSILLAPDAKHSHGNTPVHGHSIRAEIAIVASERDDSGVIVRVQPHVFGREVGRPEAGGRRPSSRISTMLVSRSAAMRSRRRRRRNRPGSRARRAGAVEVQRDLGGVEADAGVAGGRNDAAPVRVGAGDRRFHERAVGDRLGDLPGVLPRPAAVDFDGDQVRRAFAVGGNRLGQVLADFDERGAKLGERLARRAPARRRRRWPAAAPCRWCSCGRRR